VSDADPQTFADVTMVASLVRQDAVTGEYGWPLHCFGRLQLRHGQFGPIIVAVRHDRTSILPVDTARVLFGDEAINAILMEAE
jgi:hypothetical protein